MNYIDGSVDAGIITTITFHGTKSKGAAKNTVPLLFLRVDDTKWEEKMEQEMLTYEDIRSAYERIQKHVIQTPLEKSIYLSSEQKEVFLKLECQQISKAFKVRGAFNRMLMLTEEEKKRGVAAISSGNHGIAVAYAAKKLRMKNAVILVPENTPESKIEKIRYYGGEVHLLGQCFDEANLLGMQYIEEHGFTFIDGWDNDPLVYAGQGTVGLELMTQLADLDTILVPIGGGGLCTGIAVAAKSIRPDIRVIGLYSEACTAWPDSIRDHTIYNDYPSTDSVCEAMVGGIGHLSYRMHHWIDDSLMVSEQNIKKAMLHAVLNEKIVAEAAGAVPIGAMLQYGDQIPGKKIALIISGGNVKNELLIHEMKATTC